jgi:antitoxin CcdA
MGKPEKVIVELDAEIVEAAAAAGIDLSDELTRALRRKLPMPDDKTREEAAREWYNENKAAVDWHNQFIAEHGLFSDSVRKF